MYVLHTCLKTIKNIPSTVFSNVEKNCRIRRQIFLTKVVFRIFNPSDFSLEIRLRRNALSGGFHNFSRLPCVRIDMCSHRVDENMDGEQKFYSDSAWDRCVRRRRPYFTRHTHAQNRRCTLYIYVHAIMR